MRKRCVEEGLEAAVERRTQVNRKPRKLDGAGEAKLVALACSAPPEGHARWTLRLLGDKLVELEVVDSIHKETVRKALKKQFQTSGHRSLFESCLWVELSFELIEL